MQKGRLVACAWLSPTPLSSSVCAGGCLPGGVEAPLRSRWRRQRALTRVQRDFHTHIGHKGLHRLSAVLSRPSA
eukprot:scaffold296859_cov33-Tisochrysis_lutea.AAC.1